MLAAFTSFGGLFEMAGIQYASNLLAAPDDARRSYLGYANACKHFEVMHGRLQQLQKHAREVGDAEVALQQTHAFLVGLAEDTRQLDEDLRAQRRAFILKAGATVVACVLMTAIAVYVIQRRSASLAEKLQDLEEGLARLSAAPPAGHA